MADSIRDRAMDLICELFSSQRDGLPEADPYDFTWSVVQRAPLGDAARRKRYALGIIETDENKHHQVQCTQVDLMVTLEFFALLNADENPSKCLNMILTNIQRRVRSDPNLAGALAGNPGAPTPADPLFVIDFNEVANTVDVESFADRMVEGAVFCKVKYKHATNDPRLVA